MSTSVPICLLLRDVLPGGIQSWFWLHRGPPGSGLDLLLSCCEVTHALSLLGSPSPQGLRGLNQIHSFLLAYLLRDLTLFIYMKAWSYENIPVPASGPGHRGGLGLSWRPVHAQRNLCMVHSEYPVARTRLRAQCPLTGASSAVIERVHQ